jgi:hypothetical protein
MLTKRFLTVFLKLQGQVFHRFINIISNKE